MGMGEYGSGTARNVALFWSIARCMNLPAGQSPVGSVFVITVTDHHAAILRIFFLAPE